MCTWGFPGGASGKEPSCQCRRCKRLGSIPGSRRSPGEVHGSLLQDSSLDNPMDRGAWQAIQSMGVTKGQILVSISSLTGCEGESRSVVSVSLWPQDYAVHGILQARILAWAAVPFSRGSSQPRDQTQVSHIAGEFFTNWAIGCGVLERSLGSLWILLFSSMNCNDLFFSSFINL